MTETRAQLTETCWACGADAPLTDDFAPARYHRCPACGMVFQSERGLDELRALYDDDYFAEHAGGGHYADEDAQRHHEARVRLRRLHSYARSGRLLEIGSAGGHFLAEAGAGGFSGAGGEPGGPFPGPAPAPLRGAGGEG